MNISQKLRAAAMGPAPRRIDCQGNWLESNDEYWTVSRMMSDEEKEDPAFRRGNFHAFTEDECRAFIWLVACVEDEK